MSVDPKDDYYFEPQPMPEKRPGAPTSMINVNDAYRRFTISGTDAVGILYARNEPSAEDKVRVLNAMYSDYGRD